MERVFSLHSLEGYKPAILSGHKDTILGVYFTFPTPKDEGVRLLTVSKDGAVFRWRFEPEDKPKDEEREDDDEEVERAAFECKRPFFPPVCLVPTPSICILPASPSHHSPSTFLPWTPLTGHYQAGHLHSDICTTPDEDHPNSNC